MNDDRQGAIQLSSAWPKRRRTASARDGRSGCFRRQSSTRRSNSGVEENMNRSVFGCPRMSMGIARRFIDRQEA